MEYPRSSQPLPTTAKKVFSGVIFDVWQWEQKMFDGSVQVFEKASRKPSVGILALTPEKKIIVTIQEQPGMSEFVSLVGGVVEDGEEIVSCAHRELLEETGTVTDDLQLWYSVQPISKIEWPIYFFIAKNCRTVSEINLDAGEKIRVKHVSFDEFIELLYSEKFRDKEVAFKLIKLQKDAEKFAEFKRFLFE